ncbi:hypothetical protein L1049_028360 [Liquidambar formosana]|uniref:Glycosyltransferase 61 catalytic domain-containing protein n=1 Tax=Liquidambar formosana TaxID=63359 RepID=A0AAP0WTB7_LIQFO
MMYETIFAKSFSRYEQKKLGYAAVFGSLSITLGICIVFKAYFGPLSVLVKNLEFSTDAGLEMPMAKNTSIKQPREDEVRDIKPICNVLEPRSDFCEIKGDIRIQGNSSSIFVASSQKGNLAEKISWSIRPYARKENAAAMESVKKWSVNSVTSHKEIPQCTLNHSVPAILFSLGGFTGNHFHDFSDLVIPLYLTSNHFNGEVQFLVTNNKPWWIAKFKGILEKLSRYEIIDIDREEAFHCYKSVIVGLRSHKELGIDPSKSPNGFSMKDFRRFLRSTYSLNRATAIKINKGENRRPRILIICRRRSRSFTNERKIIKMARRMGYEVVAMEADISTNLPKFARMVNSCDVLMGVHGAGLTNMVFLPENAVLIQVVPLGRLDGFARYDFGEPAIDMNIRSFSRYDQKKLGCGAFVACSLIALSFCVVYKPYLRPLPVVNLRLSMDAGLKMFTIKDASSSQPIVIEANKTEAVCNVSEPNSDFCEINGDIRINGNSSTIFFASSQLGILAGNSSWSIRPYARKGVPTAMNFVTKWSVKSVTGNYFHDFTDVIIPLYLTSQQFNGEVKFLITDEKTWWIRKFQGILKGLSKYETINIDREERIHCFPKVIVGLKHHKELDIDPSKSPYSSMKDFRHFLRSSYSLNRTTAIKIRDGEQRRPRLLIIARRDSRSFTNLDEIVEMAARLGYEVIVEEAGISRGLSNFAKIVNSCDVLMGVHGAGLTNIVFLPENAILIQVVPLGGLEGWARYDFGQPSTDMNIRYLEYMIRQEESSLIEQYPLDHVVFRDPYSLHKQGWGALRSVYLDKQNVKLDVNRFKATLLEALELLHQ